VRVIDGTLRRHEDPLMAKGQDYEVEQVGVFSPEADAGRRARRRRGRLHLVANIKTCQRREDRRHDHRGRAPDAEPFPGFKELKPMVFAGLYPVEATSTRSCATRSRSCG
jgi:GTP-binding protein LepA